MSVKCFVLGDISGQFQEVFKKLSTLQAKNSFAFGIIAGNLFSDPEESSISSDDLEDLLKGKIQVPLPIYFALGNSRFPQAVIDRLESNNGELCENLFFLGRKTTIKTSEGVRVVALGGGTLEASASPEISKDAYAPFHTLAEARSLRGANTADILVTRAWPASITRGSKSSGSIPADGTSSITSGQEAVADLCATLKPRYHFSSSGGHPFFFEREPFFHPPAQESRASNPGYEITRFISLAPFGNAEKAKWIYAFSIDPTAASPITLPPATTTSPLAAAPRKRAAPSDIQEGFSRYAKSTATTADKYPPSKRSRRNQPPPGPDTCFFCLSNKNVEKHLITSIGQEAYMTVAKGPLTLTSTFLPHGLPHASHVLIIPLAHTPTLSALEPDVETYRATVKEMRRFRSSVCKMISSKSKGALGAVTWEVSRQQGIHTHWQMLPVPCHMIDRGLVEAAFKVEGENEKYPPFSKKTLPFYNGDEDEDDESIEMEFGGKGKSVGDGRSAEMDTVTPIDQEMAFNNTDQTREIQDGHPDLDPAQTAKARATAVGESNGKGDTFKVWIWTPSPGVTHTATLLTLELSSSFRFDLNLGRRVLAKLLGLEKRMQWRDCKSDEDEETQGVEEWKDLYKSFDFTLAQT